MLERTHDALWVAEGQNVRFFGVPYPTRSAIIRLENGDLWVWSPVKLTAVLRAEVSQLGPVRHLVSPNKLHHLYLKEWKAAPLSGLCDSFNAPSQAATNSSGVEAIFTPSSWP